MTTLEKAAAAVYALECSHGTFTYEDLVRAVLLSIRVPDEAMLTAGYCDAPEGTEELLAHWESLSPEDIWPAMIDSILKETP